MMLGMINASGICSIGTAQDRVPRAMATLQSSPASPDRGATHAGRRKHGGNEVTVFVIMAAILDRELQERDVFSIGGADCEATSRNPAADD
jgi:hypothetical protein